MESLGRILTPHAEDYRIRLGKHFAHKTDVTEGAGVSTVRFPFGTAVLAADAEGLTVTVTAADAETVARTRSVIVDHLDRFAFRERPLAATWTGPADVAGDDRPS